MSSFFGKIRDFFDSIDEFIMKKQLPVAEYTKIVIDKMKSGLSFIFDPLKTSFDKLMEWTYIGLDFIPATVLIVLIVLLAFFVTGRKFGLAAFTFLGLLFIHNQGYWDELINTFSLVIIASMLSVIIGVPIGILMAKSKIAEVIITPILDFMQTMPAFVYLIPAVAFFGIGMVPGVFASLIFATPPTVRFTNLGIRQVSNELVEAADAFGCTGPQKLFKVELPMAKSTIMAGINQTVMLALSMVVIASMIGARGLGREVLSSLQRADAGVGFVAGISIVILAIIMDRFTQNLNKQKAN